MSEQTTVPPPQRHHHQTVWENCAIVGCSCGLRIGDRVQFDRHLQERMGIVHVDRSTKMQNSLEAEIVDLIRLRDHYIFGDGDGRYLESAFERAVAVIERLVGVRA